MRIAYHPGGTTMSKKKGYPLARPDQEYLFLALDQHILLLSKGWSVPWGKSVQDEIYHKKEVMRKIEQKEPLTENDMLYLELAVTERNDYLDKDNGLEVDGSKASIRKKGICILRNMARVLGIDLLLVT